MKKFIVFTIGFILTACAAPIAQLPANSQPIIINVTVVAPAPQSSVVLPTPIPPVVAASNLAALAPTDSPTVIPVIPTSTSMAQITATSTGLPAVGAPVFADFTRSGDSFSLRCSPSEITFGASSINAYITGALFYYRIMDKSNLISSQWYSAGNMNRDGSGPFSIKFSALDITPDLRFDHAWFEYQFVGLNKTGDAVGRSPKFEQQVTFTKNCP